MTDLDPRLNAFRPNLADARLKGKVAAARFVEGQKRRVTAAAAPLKHVAAADAATASEVLRGEVFSVFEETAEGWAWGQLETDRYVGYVPASALDSLEPEPTHRVAALRTFVYPGPDLKLPPTACLSIGSRLALGDTAETRGTPYLLLSGNAGAVAATQVAPLDAPAENDFVTVAERFLNTPYLWGGRTSLGVDCSSLVQLALAAAGHEAPRDTDLQAAMLGTDVPGGANAPLKRGDLVFWPGHVGIMIDGEYLLHASGHHLAVVIEPLKAATERIAPVGRASCVRRLP